MIQDAAKPTGPQRQWIVDCANSGTIEIPRAGFDASSVNADLKECVSRGWIRLTRVYEVTEEGRKYV